MSSTSLHPPLPLFLLQLFCLLSRQLVLAIRQETFTSSSQGFLHFSSNYIMWLRSAINIKYFQQNKKKLIKKIRNKIKGGKRAKWDLGVKYVNI